MKAIATPIFFLLLLFFAPLLSAKTDPPPTFTPNVRPSLDVRRSSGAIKIDGDLDDAGWRDAARASNFSEVFPVERGKPESDTEALITYDDENLYVALICHDKDPNAIRSSMTNRDKIFQEDFAGIILDTYGDATWCYEIYVNPLGIQGDLRWSGDDEDEGFDLIYHTESRITSDGWQSEISIPFSSLRFPDRQKQQWRATFWRVQPRDSRRQISWAAINKEEGCWFCQWGTLNGIENVKPGTALELLPSVIGSQSSTLETPGDPESKFKNGGLDAEASLGLRYSFTPSLTAEATYNPDFSQVESDAQQVDVNTTFALSYPERRPFFQEGSDLFNSPIDVIYTRSINDPLVAAKVIGRMGRTSLAYLGAYDESTPLLLPLEERTGFVAAGKSFSNVFRARQVFAENSNVGLLATDMRLREGGSSSSFGADGVIRFLDNCLFEWQAVASHTAEPTDSAHAARSGGETFDSGSHTVGLDGEKYWGHALYGALKRFGRSWGVEVAYWDHSPTFRAANGFVTRNNSRSASVWGGAHLFPEISWIDEVNPALWVERAWNTDWLQKSQAIHPELTFKLKGQTEVIFGYQLDQELFRGIEFNNFGRYTIYANSNFSDPLHASVRWKHGEYIARNLPTPVLGIGSELTLTAQIKPMQQILIEPEFVYSTLAHPDDNGTIFDGYILRTRFNYQFNRELFLRLIVQYDNFDNFLSVEPLLTYRLNPLTSFYIGSTHSYEQFPSATRLSATSRQFFAKVQYLVQI